MLGPVPTSVDTCEKVGMLTLARTLKCNMEAKTTTTAGKQPAYLRVTMFDLQLGTATGPNSTTTITKRAHTQQQPQPPMTTPTTGGGGPRTAPGPA